MYRRSYSPLKRARDSDSHTVDERPSRRPYLSVQDDYMIPFQHATAGMPPEVPTNNGLIHTDGYYQISQPVYQSQLAGNSTREFVPPVPNLIVPSAPPQNSWGGHQNLHSNFLSIPNTIYRDPENAIASSGSMGEISRMGAPHTEWMGHGSPSLFNSYPALDFHSGDTDLRPVNASLPFRFFSSPPEENPGPRIAIETLVNHEMPVQADRGQLIDDVRECGLDKIPQTSQWPNPNPWPCASQTPWTGQQSQHSNFLSPYTPYRDPSPVSEVSRMGSPHLEFMGHTSPPGSNPEPALDLHSYDNGIRALNVEFPRLSLPEEDNLGSRVAIGALVNEMPNMYADQTQIIEDELDESELDESETDESGLEESELDESETDESGVDEMHEDQTQMDKTEDSQMEEEQVCYGMITTAYAQLLPSKPDNTHMDVDEPPLEETSIQPNVFEVILGDAGHYVLLSPTHEPFAVLDCPTAAILQSLTSCNFPSLRFQAVCTDESPSLTNSSMGTEEEEAVQFSIGLNIYGLRSFLDNVGTALRVLKAYLQQPSHVDDGVDYDNPHYLKQDGHKTPWVELRDRDEKSGDEPSFSRILTNVLESQLTHADGLREIEAVPIVKTTLLRHQKQALDFISQREAGITKDGYSLWKKSDDDDDDAMTPTFQNLLNGVQQFHPPEEPRGGIIADEMGLGKTLTMISAVAASLEEASLFAILPTPDSNDSTPTLPNTKSTLIIVPLILLSQWAEQIERHTVEGSMTFSKYHGNPKALVITNPAFTNSDIILTTYSKVSSEFGKKSMRESGLLYTRKWFRIILDEAHEVRNSKSNQFRAIRALSAERRWCLTGTPIHNSLEDLAALFQFLKVPLVDTNAHFRQQITNPIKANTHSDMGRGMRNLRLLLTTYCLRRKQTCLPQMKDQKLEEIIQHLSFEDHEHQEYEDLKVECKNAVEKAIRSVDQQKFFSVFKAIMRLRLFCNHGVAIPSTELGGGDDSMCTHCGEQIDLESEVITKGYMLVCGHSVCTMCFSYTRLQMGMVSFQREFQCQICWKASKVEEISEIGKNKGIKKSMRDIMSASVSEVDGGRQCYPTKIRTLVEDIQKNPGNEKSIVFSSWVRSLVLAERALKSAGIGYVLIDGRLKLDDRKRALKKFREDPKTMVLLMTTGTGAAGLNLTVATRVHLLEPQWNPMVEAQAIGRAARLGQSRPVTVYRYIMTTTIEENIRTRQQKKQALAEITIDSEAGTTENHMFERLTEIRSLL